MTHHDLLGPTWRHDGDGFIRVWERHQGFKSINPESFKQDMVR